MAIRVPSKTQQRRYGYVERGLPVAACPVILEPISGSVTAQASVSFRWNAVSGATSYNIYVWLATDNEPQPVNVSGVEYQTTLSLGATYRWRVTAVNDYGESSGCTYGEIFNDLGDGQSGYVEFETASSVSLESDTYIVSFGDTSLTVNVLRTGSGGAISVDYSTADGTALDGVDYTETQGTLNWPDGDDDLRPIIIPVSPQQITELESDKLYPWLTGAVADPRNSQNDHIYRAMGAADPAADPGITPTERTTLSLATLDFETAWEADFPSIEVQDLLLVGHRPELWNQNSRGVLSSQFGPLNTVAEHEKIIVTIHCNEQSPQGYDDFVASGAGTEIAYYVNSNYTLNNAPHRSNSNRPLGVWYYGDLNDSAPENASFPSVLTNRPIATEVDTNFKSGGNEVHYTQDALIECERVPVAPEIPGINFPDWTVRPEDYTYDEGTDTIYSKAPWVQVNGSYRWLALYAEDASNVVRYPLSPVLEQGDANDTEAFWTAAYDAAVLAGDLPSGMTYNAAGTGGVTTYPRNQTYAWSRTYTIPRNFSVSLSNPVNAEIGAIDTATVYIAG